VSQHSRGDATVTLALSFVGDGALLYNPVPHCLGFAARAAQTFLIVVVKYRSKRLNQVGYFFRRHNAEVWALSGSAY
jgi:hypothetical protein